MKARISECVKFFTEPFLNKYNLTKYENEENEFVAPIDSRESNIF